MGINIFYFEFLDIIILIIPISFPLTGLVFELDGLVLRYEGLHDAPADKVGYCTDAEHHHIGCGLAVESEEREVGALFGSPVEELTRTEVDAHRTDTTSHRSQML